MKNTSETEEIDRYVDNAKRILREDTEKQGGFYKDKKYVQMASGTAYNAVLMVTDEFLKQKEGADYTKPKSIEYYKKRVAKYNKNFLKHLVGAYYWLHLAGYYHGSTLVKTIQDGLEDLEKMKKMI